MSGRRRRALIIVQNLSLPFDRRPWREALTLSRAGWDVSAISPKGADRDRARREVIEGISVHRYSPWEASGGAFSYFVEWTHAVLAILALSTRVWREGRLDVVHISNPPDVLFLAVWPFRLLGAKIVFDHHDLAPEVYLSKPHGRAASALVTRILRAMERVTFAFADVVVSANESYKRIAIDRGGKRDSEVFVVRNGPELSRILDVPANPALRRGKEHLLVYVGMMGSQDGVDVLLRVIRRLADRGRDDFHALLVGDGPEGPTLRNLSRDLGLDDRITFTGLLGEREQVFGAIRTASVCLVPDPWTELNAHSTFVKVLEYMAMGRPIVAFDLAETRASAGDGALYVTPNDESEFADRVEELLESEELRSRLGEVGRRRILESLAWDHSEEQLLAAYRAALARP